MYKPAACPHCGQAVLWRHGCYYRKADRNGSPCRNPVPILRHQCAECRRTCSQLPLCIAPRRWYDWAVQQIVLQCLFNGASVRHCHRITGMARHTIRRWRNWLASRTADFSFRLRCRFPDFGRWNGESFWPQVITSLSLSNAMAWLDREVNVP